MYTTDLTIGLEFARYSIQQLGPTVLRSYDDDSSCSRNATTSIADCRNDQFTPPTPTRQNCRVSSRRAVWIESATVSDSLRESWTVCEQFAIDGIITYWLLNWNQSQPVVGSRCTAAVERLGLSEFKYAERVQLLPTRRYASTVLLWSGVCVCLSVCHKSEFDENSYFTLYCKEFG